MRHKRQFIILEAVATCMGSKPKVQAPPTQIDAGDPAVTAARDDERRRRRAATSNTFLTSYSGTSTAPVVTTKTLMGT